MKLTDMYIKKTRAMMKKAKATPYKTDFFMTSEFNDAISRQYVFGGFDNLNN